MAISKKYGNWFSPLIKYLLIFRKGCYLWQTIHEPFATLLEQTMPFHSTLLLLSLFYKETAIIQERFLIREVASGGGGALYMLLQESGRFVVLLKRRGIVAIEDVVCNQQAVFLFSSSASRYCKQNEC